MTLPRDPAEVRVVADAAAFKAMADPLRLRMLEVLGVDPHRLWTVKELAAELGQPVTKLYHHMKLLESAQLVIDAETRLVSGIVEHRYRCAQRSLRVDERLFGQPAMRDEARRGVISIVDQGRADLVRYLDGAHPDLDSITVGRALARLSADEYAEVQRRLDQIIDDIAAGRTDQDRANLPRAAITVFMHPAADD